MFRRAAHPCSGRAHAASTSPPWPVPVSHLPHGAANRAGPGTIPWELAVAPLTDQAVAGTTVGGCLRARRRERARYFLQTTALSVPAIAAPVGIPDLQAFNKACRRDLGASPRGICTGLNSQVVNQATQLPWTSRSYGHRHPFPSG
ncbi:helix-turn-helix domain-containing protein [Kitasatospora sp. NPDC048365]|uniref:helix-turn-helix domain-containing protein n=1 Tax=Kitasatospora sp. NPDC048365 TaxID=3364050 RepID=UPI003715FE10